MTETDATKPASPGVGAKLLIDLGPLLVFFGTNYLAPVPDELQIFYATGAFMAAMIVALLYSQIRYKHVSPMLMFSGLLVVVLGGITIWLHDKTFIKMKPTGVYAAFGAVLWFGLATGRNLLQSLLGTAYPGLSDAGWGKLTRNWIIFFFTLAVLNEVIWRNSSDDFWAGSKLWFFLPATFVFALANVPMLMRHGLQTGEAADEPPIPPTQ